MPGSARARATSASASAPGSVERIPIWAPWWVRWRTSIRVSMPAMPTTPRSASQPWRSCSERHDDGALASRTMSPVANGRAASPSSGLVP